MILRDREIIATVARLQRRIGERFPTSGLYSLCGQLLDVSRQASQRAHWIEKPIRSLRYVGYGLTVLLVVSALLLVYFTFEKAKLDDDAAKPSNLFPLVESISNEAVLLGAAIYFLFSLEKRIKRQRALAAIHELRSIAHIIDMHQLTKDPERMFREWENTPTSPQIQMSPLQLNRYLDYCTEMLSLTGKIAALYVQRFDDATSLAAVSEIEELTTSLSRKIWQKIMILENRQAE